MQLHEFYRSYSNLNLDNRFRAINIEKYGLLTPAELYAQIIRAEEYIRPQKINLEELLKIADDYFNNRI